MEIWGLLQREQEILHGVGDVGTCEWINKMIPLWEKHDIMLR